jgi:hypothetical protein
MASFNYHARQVVDPTLPMSIRYLALGSCIRRLTTMTHLSRDHRNYQGLRCFPAHVKRPVWHDHYEHTRTRFNKRFHFDDASAPQPEQLIGAIAAIQIERNKLLEAERVLYRRRVSLKMRGIRTPSLNDQKAFYEYWITAVLLLEAES